MAPNTESLAARDLCAAAGAGRAGRRLAGDPPSRGARRGRRLRGRDRGAGSPASALAIPHQRPALRADRGLRAGPGNPVARHPDTRGAGDRLQASAGDTPRPRFQPAALALLVAIPLFATDQSWWGALPDLAWPWTLLLLVGGIVLVDRLNKLPLLIAFLGVYFGLFTAGAFADPLRVSEMFRPPFVQAALFLGLFMLTDPPTSPSRYADQVWIGALVAVACCLAQLLGAGQSYLLIGLLVGNVALAVRRGVGPRSSPCRGCAQWVARLASSATRPPASEPCYGRPFMLW